MSLLTILDAELAFGLQPLLDGASLTVQPGDRIGLIGRNGTGKSSVECDCGTRRARRWRNQEKGRPVDRDGRTRADVATGTDTAREPGVARRPECKCGHAREAHDDRERWRIEARLIEYMHRLGLDEAADPARLSGGERKRGALALAFALAPDLMLLDEPTNHLDIDGITLLEELLAKQTMIVITHDRAFLDRVTTRIVELDRGLLRSYPGNYSAGSAARGRAGGRADRRPQVRQVLAAGRSVDSAWHRSEAHAQRGKSGAARTVAAARAARRENIGRVKLALDAGERSGKLVTELTDVTKRFGATLIADRLSLRILRGDRID